MDYSLLDIDLNSLPNIKVKNTRGIYFLYDRGELVYIGQSICIQRRIFQHFHGDNKIYIKEFDSYRFIEINDDESLDKIEQLFILEYQPKYNKNTLGMGVYSKDLRKPKESRQNRGGKKRIRK